MRKRLNVKYAENLPIALVITALTDFVKNVGMRDLSGVMYDRANIGGFLLKNCR